MKAVSVMWRMGRELSLVFVVAVAVALAGTLAGSVLDHTHQVDAEETGAHEVPAEATEAGMQQLAVAEWGVRMTAPLAREMPLLRYAAHSAASVGLSSADLEQIGPACRASRDGLGALLRLPAGTYAEYAARNVRMQFVKTVGEYDFAYQAPQNDCAHVLEAQQVINRELSVLSEALASLAPTRD